MNWTVWVKKIYNPNNVDHKINIFPFKNHHRTQAPNRKKKTISNKYKWDKTQTSLNRLHEKIDSDLCAISAIKWRICVHHGLLFHHNKIKWMYNYANMKTRVRKHTYIRIVRQTKLKYRLIGLLHLKPSLCMLLKIRFKSCYYKLRKQ